MFDSVLVVCAGNICRSPTGEYVLKQKLEGKNIKVSSAGLTALEGKPADATTKRIALANGVSSPAGSVISSIFGIETYLDSDAYIFVEWPKLLEPLLDNYTEVSIYTNENQDRVLQLKNSN